MIVQFDTCQPPVFISSPNHDINAQEAQEAFLRYAANQWAELKARFLLVNAEEMSWSPLSQIRYPSTLRSRYPLKPRSQNGHFWTLEDRMKRIQTRTTLQRRYASPNLSRQSTTPDLKALHAHYARQRMHGEAYDEYECRDSSPKRKRAITGIRDGDKTSQEMLPFVRPRHSYQRSYNERQPQWSLGVQVLVDSHIDAIVDHEMADFKDESCFQSNATPGFSIGADNTSMKHIIYSEFGVPSMFERGLASKKTTDPRPRPRSTKVDINTSAAQELPSAHHHPCRAMYEAEPIHRNKSSEIAQASEPIMQTTADLMREIFGDGEVDDVDSVLPMIKSMNIM
ncbi:uncharacterized protein EDB93DRAFT_1114127 [Suillus bovinus]|uniref:uncharacterized protein n=1 Tax=Suillus bovinus TaxID=48563 RepID=UPI001B881100|nr:uncharacterized protein EDB93DRAFT_1114127 [Suillus bovinus]KAG2160218.1 hypothetical protein EDB93DRAFT_1114127 [Suillus bovinus]